MEGDSNQPDMEAAWRLSEPVALGPTSVLTVFYFPVLHFHLKYSFKYSWLEVPTAPTAYGVWNPTQ